MPLDLDDLNTIQNLMGVLAESFYNTVSSQRNKGELVASTKYEYTKRKTISQTLFRQLQIRGINDFCHGDESSNIV